MNIIIDLSSIMYNYLLWMWNKTKLNYTYNPQSQLTIFSLFSLIPWLHVSVPTGHLQVNHINIFEFMRRITILINTVKMVRRDRNV
jgi:hypothetical protein